MLKKSILLLLTLVVTKICFGQQQEALPIQKPASFSSFTELLKQTATNISNTDYQLLNQHVTLSPTGVPLTPIVTEPTPSTPSTSKSDIGFPDISLPGLSDTASSSTTSGNTATAPLTRQQIKVDSIKNIQNLKNEKNSRQSTPGNSQMYQQQQPVENSVQVKPENPFSTQSTKHVNADSIFRARRAIQVYGKGIFEEGTIKEFNRSNDAVAPDNYVLGVGDKVSISVWGYSSYNQTFVVDETGAINPTETGKIYLKGIAFKDAKDIMTKRFSQVFDLHNSQIDFALLYARDITVNIVGEVTAPGSYHLPATNTAFNALIAAHGPNGIGSVRNIFIKRGGKTIKTLDVYQFLQNPNSNQDFFLENNDYIFVPAAKKIVQVAGQVERPMSYELLDNENLFDIIKYAGGIKADAYTKSVQITRYQNSHAEIIDINLDSLTKANADYALVNGDKINISELPSTLLTYVEISGPIKIPGQYEYNKGMKVSDLLSKSQGVTEDAYLDLGYIVRTLPDLSKQYISFIPKNVINDSKSTDNLVLQNQDVVDIFQKSNFVNNLSVTISGAVHTPGTYTFGQGFTLRDLLLYSGGLLPTAANNRIEISRIMNSANGNPPYTVAPAIVKTVQIGNDLSIDQASAGFQLQPYDIVFVRQSPSYSSQATVSISGEVLYPGTYTILNKGEKIASLISRAGGPSAYAYLENATLKRSEDSTGYIISNLKKALKDTTSKFNVLVKPGDTIIVPTVTDIVSITGAVNYPFLDPLKKVNTPYHRGWRARHYIKVYGDGFAKQAWRTHSYVIQPGGRVQRVRRFLIVNITPRVKKGGGVFVAYKQKAINTQQPSPPINWAEVIRDTTTKIVGLLTLYVLIDKVILNK